MSAHAARHQSLARHKMRELGCSSPSALLLALSSPSSSFVFHSDHLLIVAMLGFGSLAIVLGFGSSAAAAIVTGPIGPVLDLPIVNANIAPDGVSRP
jgi:hypothetical protein